jgi:hypothetical protein
MREEMQSRPPDALIAALAKRQHGVVGYAQLLALGLSRQSIDHRVRCGRLHRIHRGVYAVGHKRLTRRGRFMAAVLAGGEGAVLSHRSAAALWGILPQRGDIHVTTARALRKRDGLHFHSQSLQFDEVTEHDGIPLTTVARTLIDIAATEPAQFERAFNEAEFRRLYDQTGVLAILSRNPSRRGTVAIRAVAERAALGRTREELEQRFLALLDKHGLPRPELNADLELEPGRWIQPDCLWRDARLIVELDSRAAHNTTSRFDSDRERDRLLALAGLLVIRVTWKHVTADARGLAADLRELIATRR